MKLKYKQNKKRTKSCRISEPANSVLTEIFFKEIERFGNELNEIKLKRDKTVIQQTSLNRISRNKLSKD